MTDYLLVMAMMTIALIAVLLALIAEDRREAETNHPERGEDTDLADRRAPSEPDSSTNSDAADVRT